MGTQAKILLIEGRGKRVRSFAPELRNKEYQVRVAHTGNEVQEILATFSPDVVIMDTTFYPSSGVRLCKSVNIATSGAPLIYISAAGRNQPPSIKADVSLGQPFTIRKLANRINQLLPAVDGLTFQVGPLILNADKRMLVRKEREHRLTPKQAHLLEVFMRHPGRVINRGELMKRVWDTDFMDDTRTLDVHIRWVREAVEENPSKPRYITTVRGRGYLFAIPGDEPPQAP